MDKECGQDRGQHSQTSLFNLCCGICEICSLYVNKLLKRCGSGWSTVVKTRWKAAIKIHSEKILGVGKHSWHLILFAFPLLMIGSSGFCRCHIDLFLSLPIKWGTGEGNHFFLNWKSPIFKANKQTKNFLRFRMTAHCLQHSVLGVNGGIISQLHF